MGAELTKGVLDLTGHFSAAGMLVQASAIATGTVAVTEIDAHQTGYDTAAGATLTIALQPAEPRGVVLWFVDADGSADHVGSVIVTGLDQNGVGVSETIALPSTTGHAHGVRAYTRLTSVIIASCTGTYGENDHISLGYDNRVGLPAAPGAIYGRCLQSSFDGAPDAGTFSATYGTYNVAGTLDGAKDVMVTFTYKMVIPN
jgi:hypothetical protein